MSLSSRLARASNGISKPSSVVPIPHRRQLLSPASVVRTLATVNHDVKHLPDIWFTRTTPPSAPTVGSDPSKRPDKTNNRTVKLGNSMSFLLHTLPRSHANSDNPPSSARPPGTFAHPPPIAPSLRDPLPVHQPPLISQHTSPPPQSLRPCRLQRRHLDQSHCLGPRPHRRQHYARDPLRAHDKEQERLCRHRAQ